MATELAKAYVQIVPSAQGIKKSIEEVLGTEVEGAGATAGRSFGEKMVGAFKGVLAAAGIGKALSAAISEGAALEQSIGGVETLFKGSADQVIANAEKAFQTAGVSANSYMEQVTSFSATLLQGLGGDTDAAARIADQAIVQMADNANKMGTDMASIQYAYQGFAKDNYDMLDNLKLGYGGTQAEMARLINDSGVLGDSVQVTAETVKDVPFDKIIEAIGVIQDDLGITGTTAEEAATTLSGSLASMKASFSNVLGGLTLGQDIGPALNGLAQTTTTFLVGNLLPALWNILRALPGALVTFIQTAVPQLVAALMDFVPQLTNGVTFSLPQLLQTGSDALGGLIDGIFTALPEMYSAALETIGAFLNEIIANLPSILNSGSDILLHIVQGIGNALPQMLTSAARLVAQLLTGIVTHLPQIISAGFDLVVNLITGIGNALPDLIPAALDVVSTIWDTIQDIDWLGLGKDIIQGLIDGIGSMAGALWDAATNIAGSALDAIKEFFGIASPSRLMRREVGPYIPDGLALGIQENTRPVINAMRGLTELSAETAQKDLFSGLRDISGPNAMDAGPGGGSQIEINVYGAPGQDVNELARILMERIQQETDRRGAIFA